MHPLWGSRTRVHWERWTRPKEHPLPSTATPLHPLSPVSPKAPANPQARLHALLILTFLPGVRTMGGAGVGMMAVGGMAWGNGVKVCWCVC